MGLNNILDKIVERYGLNEPPEDLTHTTLLVREVATDIIRLLSEEQDIKDVFDKQRKERNKAVTGE